MLNKQPGRNTFLLEESDWLTNGLLEPMVYCSLTSLISKVRLDFQVSETWCLSLAVYFNTFLEIFNRTTIFLRCIIIVNIIIQLSDKR